MTRLSKRALIYRLKQQVKAARDLRVVYLIARAQSDWTVQGQQMLDGLNRDLAYFECELEETRALCLQSKS